MTKTGEKLHFSFFLVTFSLLSLFRYFFVTLNFSGFRALWDLLPLTIPAILCSGFVMRGPWTQVRGQSAAASRPMLLLTQATLAGQCWTLPGRSAMHMTTNSKTRKWGRQTGVRQLFRKVWVSIKFLSANFGLTPPPEKGPK